MITKGELRLLEEKERQLLELQKVYQECLPHKYGFKWYKWQRQFHDCLEKIAVLVASNQCGKSTAQHRTEVEWSTNKTLWKTLWRKDPRQFWILYPTTDIICAEWETKILPDIMPRGILKDDPQYGWEVDRSKREIHAVRWNSGVTWFFKTYNQNVHALQSGTCDAIFCFPAGTKIIAKNGLVSIEDLKVGDLVLSQHGWKPVTRLMHREAPVIERTFSNGTTIRATANHPFFTANRGWIAFGELLESDECATVPAWKQIKKLSCLKARSSLVFRSIPTIARGITSGLARVVDRFMSPFGKLCTSNEFQRDTSSITSTSTLSTTVSRIFSSSPGPNTLGFIKKKSGERQNPGSSPVRSVGNTSRAVAPKGLLRGFARNAVDVLQRFVNAFFAASLSRLGEKARSVSVLPCAQTEESIETVYNLTVADSHTYFAEGLLVHNCDEELPSELWDELMFRLEANDGYFRSVFTPTRNQLFWFQVMECIGTDQEKLKEAFKLHVSAYDCQTFEDGSPGIWTAEKINKTKGRCRSETEIQRRIFGRFVTEEGRLFPGFDPARNMMAPREIPHDWHLHTGVDIGAGGGSNHPAAIVFLAVNPDCTEGEIFDGWRGDEEQTTAGDVFQKYIEMRGSRTMASEAYDSQSKDFGTISERAGESFQMAQKGQEIGYGILNTLLKTGRLRIHDTPELQKLAQEFMTVMAHTKKSSAKDDFADAARFACSTAVPWDWTSIEKLDRVIEPPRELTPLEREIKERRGDYDKPEPEGWTDLNDEIAYWNELSGS